MPALPPHLLPPQDRQASAPYNFVPMPEAVSAVARVVAGADGEPEVEGLPALDRLDTPGFGRTGWIDVEIEAMSPLFIRGPMAPGDVGKKGDPAVKNRPAFFHTGDPRRPVVPGSSLRGMLRGVIEVASAGKLVRVTDKGLFHRGFDGSSMAVSYALRMKQEEGGRDALRCGYLRVVEGEHEIVEVKGFRVPLALLGRDDEVYDGRGPNRTPAWQDRGGRGLHQYARVRFTDDGKKAVKVSPGGPGRDGVLVLSGAMQGKKHDWVFELPSAEASRLPVSDALVERFNDDDQVSQWQQKAFPEDRPEAKARRRKGHLIDLTSGREPAGLPGEPVFFLVEGGRVAFFGRARYFRLPYRQTPLDLVPEAHKDPAVIDYAEALFGFVRQTWERERLEAQGVAARGAAVARAGRVTVSDGVCLSGGDVFLEAFTPRILSTPNPSSFQLYLTQTHHDEKGLRHFDSDPTRVTLRGVKRYWPQGPRSVADLREGREVSETSTQHTRMTPVKAGTRFGFRVHFTSLSDREFGALLWALRLPGDAHAGRDGVTHVHQLGMGKPLGMGAVAVRHAAVTLLDAGARYAALGAPGTAGATADDERAALAAFTGHVADPAGRRAALLAMMRWPGRPADPAGGIVLRDRPNTRYMEIERSGGDRKENEYKRRRVLPPIEAFYDDLVRPERARDGKPDDLRAEEERLKRLDGPPGVRRGGAGGGDRGPGGGAWGRGPTGDGRTLAERRLEAEAEALRRQTEALRAEVPGMLTGEPTVGTLLLGQLEGGAGPARKVRLSMAGWPVRPFVGGADEGLQAGEWVVVRAENVNASGVVGQARYVRRSERPGEGPPEAAVVAEVATPAAAAAPAEAGAPPPVPAAASIEAHQQGMGIRARIDGANAVLVLRDAAGQNVKAVLGSLAEAQSFVGRSVTFVRITRPDGVVRAEQVVLA